MDAKALPVPVADGPKGVGKPAMGFMDGTDGETRYAWARYASSATGWFGAEYGTGWFHGGSTGGARLSREGAQAATVAQDLLTSNPIVATLTETLTTNALGTGLTLSSKPDADALGITEEQSRALARVIERRWAAWAGNPLEADLAGRHSLHELAGAAFDSWQLTGDVVVVIEWAECRGAQTRTKVNLLDARQLDRTKTGEGIVQGVQFDKTGRVAGYWLRPLKPGSIEAAQSVFVEAFTPWGRPRVLHIYHLKLPGQIRGISPLVAALTPAHEKNSLAEFALGAAMVGAQFAMTVESDLPPNLALGGLNSEERSVDYDDLITTRGKFYGNVKIKAAPGTITHLAPGDKLKMNRAEAPNSTFDDFDRSLTRTAARAAGASYEEVSGDLSKTSFSASRLAMEAPYRLMLRRRAMILEKLYQVIFGCWLEEQINVGAIELPPEAPEFIAARDAYTAGRWMGMGRIVADPKKAVEADLLEVENGFSTLTDKLAERGLDFDTVLAQRAHELKAIKAAGLLGVSIFPGTVTTQNRFETREDEPPETTP